MSTNQQVIQPRSTNSVGVVSPLHDKPLMSVMRGQYSYLPSRKALLPVGWYVLYYIIIIGQ